MISLHEKNNFRLTKICEKDRKDHIFVSFRKFPFHGNIIFSGLSFKRKYKKAASFRKCAFCQKYEIFVYTNWTYTITGRIVTKTSYFLLVSFAGGLFIDDIWAKRWNFLSCYSEKKNIGQLHVEDVFIFPTISRRKRGRRIAGLLLFFSFMVVKACSL